MKVVELSGDNFVEVVSRPGITLVECWTQWCNACKTFNPIFEKVAANHPQHTFGKLDTQTEKTIAGKLQIKHTPTLLLYRDGLLLFQQPGSFDDNELEGIVRQAEALDMDDVRAQIEREQAKGVEDENGKG
jgi:thioredoxin 1